MLLKAGDGHSQVLGQPPLLDPRELPQAN